MLHLILVLAVVGFISWLVMQIPMAPIFKNVILGVCAFAAIIFTLQTLGFNTGFARLGRF